MRRELIESETPFKTMNGDVVITIVYTVNVRHCLYLLNAALSLRMTHSLFSLTYVDYLIAVYKTDCCVLFYR